jgi:SagB-type dehydrogenase family enzyme
MCLRVPGETLPLGNPPLGIRRALAALVDGASYDALGRMVDADGAQTLIAWALCLGTLLRGGCLSCDVVDAGRVLATATARPRFQPGSGELAVGARWVLSRFAYVRCVDGALVVESAIAGGRIELRDARLLRLAVTLTRPATVEQVLAERGDLEKTPARDFLDLLAYAGLVTCVRDDGIRTEDAVPGLAEWDFADVLLHTTSRSPRYATAPNGDQPRLPTVKAPMSAAIVQLRTPGKPLLAGSKQSFHAVLERRRSRRAHDDTQRPISKSQLSEFLYRAARVKRVVTSRTGEPGYEHTERPYPGAGACYELETYLVVQKCRGLSAGLYHYEPAAHCLERLEQASADALERLLSDACAAAALPSPPQVLVILAARFARLTTKYGPGSYALILKDAGILLQTMCLVATALDLGACIVGGGDAETFARAAGTHPYEESSVGELLLGSLA